jgi:hypothetical protein
VEGLDLPRGLEREIVLDERDRSYELNGEDSRTLATVGAFRVVSESDLRDSREGAFDPRDDDYRHLRDQGLVRSVSLDGRERVVTLTERGRSLLEGHRRDRDDERHQEFRAGISRPRELTHDASLYRAYLRAEERLREQGADIRRVVLRFRKATALYRYAVRDAFITPLTPAQVEELDWFFRARQGRATDPAPDPELDLARCAQKFGAARFRAVHRRWEREGMTALWSAQSTSLRDQMQRGWGRVELSHQYLQLTPLVGVA